MLMWGATPVVVPYQEIAILHDCWWTFLCLSWLSTITLCLGILTSILGIIKHWIFIHFFYQNNNPSVLMFCSAELGQGKSYWNRLRFLDTCEFIIELFSKSFFCEYFFLPVLELTHDPVANVRYCTNYIKLIKHCDLFRWLCVAI